MAPISAESKGCRGVASLETIREMAGLRLSDCNAATMLAMDRKCQHRVRECRPAPLGRFSHGHELELGIDRRGRTVVVQHLLLAEAEGLKALARNFERVDHDVADHVGPPLAERQIVFASAGRGGMADDQEFVCPQRGMAERIGDSPERPVGFRPNHRAVLVELDIGGGLREVEQFRRDRRPFERGGVGLGPGLDAVRCRLLQGGDIDIRRGVGAGEPDSPFFRRAGRLGLRECRNRHRAGQYDREQSDAAPADAPETHQRYPASVRALLQLMVIPRGPAKTQSSALARSALTLAQYLLTSRSHNLVTETRAATRFWMASKART